MIRFRLKRGHLTAVDGVTFTVNRGETFGLVGESGIGQDSHGALGDALGAHAAGRNSARAHSL